MGLCALQAINFLSSGTRGRKKSPPNRPLKAEALRRRHCLLKSMELGIPSAITNYAIWSWGFSCSSGSGNCPETDQRSMQVKMLNRKKQLFLGGYEKRWQKAMPLSSLMLLDWKRIFCKTATSTLSNLYFNQPKKNISTYLQRSIDLVLAFREREHISHLKRESGSFRPSILGSVRWPEGSFTYLYVF